VRKSIRDRKACIEVRLCKSPCKLYCSFFNCTRSLERRPDRSRWCKVLRFSPNGEMLAVGSGESAIDFYRCESDLLFQCTVTPLHGVECMEYLPASLLWSLSFAPPFLR
jgi:hypothetical protein